MPPGLSSAMTMKRIHREIADLQKEDLGSMTLAPVEDNLYLWKGTIPGPEGSVYEGGVFNVEVHLASDYPFSAPRVLFKTRIYHMNISDQGSICIDILKSNWSPALSLFKVMLSLSSLLTDPNPKDPLVPSIATQYTRNRRLHDSTARQWTEMYAKPPKPPPAVQSAKAKGKRKADPPSDANTSSTRSGEQVIVLDSDEEVNGQKSKRKRAVEPASGEVLNLADADDTGSTGSARRKKQKTGRISDVGGSGEAAKQPSEVIVIDD